MAVHAARKDPYGPRSAYRSYRFDGCLRVGGRRGRTCGAQAARPGGRPYGPGRQDGARRQCHH